jgi:alginate O-acetyltransferase complex protein AlgJ
MREVGHTTVSPAVARGLLGFFLAAIAAVSVFEAVGAVRRVDAVARTAWARLLTLPTVVRAGAQGDASIGTPGVWNRTVSANRAALAELSAFEDALEDESLLGRTLRPHAQRVLSGWLGGGNERVYIGRDGWLFYAPDVEYLTGPPFLDDAWMRRRVASASEWRHPPQPDPREAILRFHTQLQDLGIALVVMPTPLKPGIHPDRLSSRYSGRAEPLHNSSYGPLIAQLESAGVVVFDPAAVLADARQSGAQYLETDTHWRPEAMELVAERLADFIRSRLELPSSPGNRYRTDEHEVAHVGDTAAMLDLPPDQMLYPPERVWIRRVTESDGRAWRPSRDADVLVLGDSYSNIYSLASMGWGDSAGFIEQISYALNRPVDRVVQNDAGAHATRALLLRAGRQRLDGKRLVIWQFAARELAFGDWQVIDVPK